MQFQFAFKHMESSPSLSSYAEEKLKERIEKYVTKPIDALVVFSVVRHEQTAHVHLRAGDGFGIEVEHTCEDMYASIDQLADKLSAQLKKHKEKLKNHKAIRRAMSDAHAEVVNPTDAVQEAPVNAEDIVKFEAARKRGSAR